MRNLTVGNIMKGKPTSKIPYLARLPDLVKFISLSLPNLNSAPKGALKNVSLSFYYLPLSCVCSPCRKIPLTAIFEMVSWTVVEWLQ